MTAGVGGVGPSSVVVNSSLTRGNNNMKRRGGRRILPWICFLVIVVVVFIFVQNEVHLRRINNEGMKDVTWKDIKSADKTLSSSSTTTTALSRPKRTNKNAGMDDDLFTYWRGQKAEDKLKRKKIKEQLISNSLASLDEQSSNRPSKSKKRVIPAKKKLDPFPVIQNDDDSIPQGVAGSISHAADALLCRDSVIDYVINATDLKDECDGLKKAFTKNCADEEAPVLSTQRQRQRRQQRNRRLQKSSLSFSRSQHQFFYSKNPIIYLQSRIYYLSRYLQSWWFKQHNDTFLAEDEILNLWDDAAFEVEQGWDMMYRDDDITTILRNTTTNTDASNDNEVVIDRKGSPSWDIPIDERNHTKEERDRRLRNLYYGRRRQKQNDDTTQQQRKEKETKDQKEESDDEDTEENDDVQANTTAATTAKPAASSNKQIMANLALPTTNRHVSDKMLHETLMLQQDGKIMRAVHNQTNQTSAQVDAAASTKAIADAADVVSSLLNDPSSVEARTCCTSILNVFHENCSVNEEEELSDLRLFVAVAVIAVCGLVKSLIRHFSIRWLPEAAGCILVGGTFLLLVVIYPTHLLRVLHFFTYLLPTRTVTAGYLLTFFPHHDMSFNPEWFLRIMVPPIVFEAALSIDKQSFNRHVVPILLYAVVGTLMATGVTAIVVHEGSTYLHGLCETIPYPEALAFGALISSIDPIAVLSVLSNMGMTDLDTIYVVIFGESLLNDGVAIVLFETLVHFLDDNMEVDKHAIMAASIHFLVVFIGSLLIGVASGLCCTVYYWVMHGCQTPLVEVLMFCCWALLPYYVCDGIEWSGIVAVVAAGFIMDMYVVGTHIKDVPTDDFQSSLTSLTIGKLNDSFSDLDAYGNDKSRRRRRVQVRRPIFSKDGLLGLEAKTHIGFVTEIIATMMETAIFAYLGLFLFSSRYHWNFYHVVIAISGCCVSRAVMIPTLSFVANWITRIQQVSDNCVRSQPFPQQATQSPSTPEGRPRKAAGVVVDGKMQLVLWFAGLRGAMSFALVEHIPLYDAVTGEGTRLKSELKAMTSASIIFTVFILGGGTYYMMEFLGLVPKHADDIGGPSIIEREMEMMGLLSLSNEAIENNNEDGEDKKTNPQEENSPDVFKPSVPDKAATPRRPGRPVRRQRKPTE